MSADLKRPSIGLAGTSPHQHLMLTCSSGAMYDLGDIRIDIELFPEVAEAINGFAAAAEERDALRKALNTPEFHDFIKGVPLEAAHQLEKWGHGEPEVGKTCLDWFWLIGYLAQRVVEYDRAGNREKALHHTVTTAAAIANWNAALQARYRGEDYAMRPGSGKELEA